jgi:hypothetical protein
MRLVNAVLTGTPARTTDFVEVDLGSGVFIPIFGISQNPDQLSSEKAATDLAAALGHPPLRLMAAIDPTGAIVYDRRTTDRFWEVVLANGTGVLVARLLVSQVWPGHWGWRGPSDPLWIKDMPPPVVNDQGMAGDAAHRQIDFGALAAEYAANPTPVERAMLAGITAILAELKSQRPAPAA